MNLLFKIVKSRCNVGRFLALPALLLRVDKYQGCQCRIIPMWCGNDAGRVDGKGKGYNRASAAYKFNAKRKRRVLLKIKKTELRNQRMRLRKCQRTFDTSPTDTQSLMERIRPITVAWLTEGQDVPPADMEQGRSCKCSPTFRPHTKNKYR